MVHPYRERNLAELAHKLGCSFYPTDELGLLTQLQDFKLFSEGYKKKVERVLRMQDGMMEFDMAVFDYSFKKWGATDNSGTSYQTVFFLHSRHLGLPEFWMQPETLGHKIGELLGFKDIDFVRFPKFSGQYRLTGEDEEYIRHHFPDPILHYFTTNKGWSMEGLGFYLLFYRKGTLIPSAEIENFYRRGRELYDLMVKNPL